MKLNDIKNITILFPIILLSILSLYPYFIWGNSYIYKITLILSFISYIFILKKNDFLLKKNIVFSFILLLFWISYAFFPRGSVDISIPNTGVFAILLYCLLPAVYRSNAFRYFRFVLSLILLISLIQYPFIVARYISPLNELIPFSEIKQERNQFYFNYIFNIILNDQFLNFFNYSFFRFSSIFDEPGLLGTISAILLFTYQSNESKKLEKFIFLLSLVLSFSLGGYLLFIIGVLIKLMLNFDIKRLILFFSLLTIFTSILANTDGGRRYITDRILNTKQPITQTREDSSFSYKFNEKILSNGYYLTIGLGKDAHLKTGDDVSSYKGFIYNYGVFGLTLLLSVLILIAYINDNINKQSVIILSLIFINFYQRPIEFNVYYYIIILSIIMKDKNNNAV
uniref:Wzy n=1 Tax=Proteus vulgaris TaxID=585 RepID=A0A385JNA1_PROVU|nr:wzy [Proteus vulgaris]